MKKIIIYWIYLMVVWGSFRLLFKFDNTMEELVIKPLVWSWPIIGWQWSKKGRVNVFKGNFLKAILGGIGLGMAFIGVVVLANWLKVKVGLRHGSFIGFNGVEIVTLGLATAIVEEMVFAGYILTKLKQIVKDDNWAMLIAALMFTALHIPIALFVYGYWGVNLGFFLMIVGLVAIAKYWLVLRTENVWSAIVAHWMWGLLVWAIG